ncbi:Matrixin [Pirellulimonas nuda]|uniref:Matrixin n=1 Tax=Pirellulimonas nuda TaxID=2528009 RepID=A0A518DD52_9BACT|nr:matrixin family metalloprotease [Pirellulimonas nuda]QDU89414.1 Matrixin [Pirellulimonas nuda]
MHQPLRFAFLLSALLGAVPDAAGFFANGSWPATAVDGPTPASGVPITLTWSIVADGVPIPSLGPSPGRANNLAAVFDGLIGGSGVPDVVDKPWFALIEDSFDRWAELSGVTLLYEPNDDGQPLGAAPGVPGVRGDIRLAGASIDGVGTALGQSGYLPDGDITLDTSEAAYFGDPTDDYLRFRHTLMHEIGHSLGLGHTESFNALVLMSPTASTAFDGPQFDDLRGAHQLYGDAYEKQAAAGNNAPGSATPLGALAIGGSLQIGGDVPASSAPIGPQQTDFVSITNQSDEDYFAFTIAEPASVDLTLTPVGRTYSERSNPSDLYTTVNSARQSDLSLQLYRAAGGTPVLLATAAAAGLGVAESLLGVELSLPGEYLVRVAGGADSVQFYSLAIAAEAVVIDPPTLVGDFNQDGLVDAADYSVWRDLLGTSTPLANAPDSPGIVDQADYQSWRTAFGGRLEAAGVTPVPEPASVTFCIVVAALTYVRRTAWL